MQNRPNNDNRLTLYDTLKNSYASRDKQKGAFKDKNYVYDSDLSNHNEQVYYNPKEKKLLYSIAGTHNIGDLGTDLYLAAGHLKDTNRYKEAESKLREAKKRYGVDSATVVGHSLGNSLAQYVSSKNDKVIGLNGGYTIGQPTRSNATSYRTKGDLVSLLGRNETNVHNLENPNTPSMFGGIVDAYRAHNIDNIKNEKIYV